MRIAAEHTFVLLVVLAIGSTAGQQMFNVHDYDAAGDGKTDDAQAFLATWRAACNDNRWPIMVIPASTTFLLSQVQFNGPCKAPITIQLNGNILAPNYIWTKQASNLLTFFDVDNLTMDGTGQIDGQGAVWWTCYHQKSCHTRPILLAFARCNNLRVSRIQLKNSADKHMSLYQCSQVRVQGVSITAPGDSPNTDGITMAVSDHVQISHCSFKTGDDCVSILSNTTDVNVTQSTCGPGHGISIGSLGGDQPSRVERVLVSGCNFYGTLTGVRIKSWQGGKGFAEGFLFENINMTAVQHPIIIDQFYCPQGNCPLKNGGVAIRNARFINIHGTSYQQQAIQILCSQSVRCQGIYLENIMLSWENHSAPANASILNASGATSGRVIPEVQFPST